MLSEVELSQLSQLAVSPVESVTTSGSTSLHHSRKSSLAQARKDAGISNSKSGELRESPSTNYIPGRKSSLGVVFINMLRGKKALSIEIPKKSGDALDTNHKSILGSMKSITENNTAADAYDT